MRSHSKSSCPRKRAYSIHGPCNSDKSRLLDRPLSRALTNERLLAVIPAISSLLSAQQKHRLLAEQIPEPPRCGEAQAPAPGVERDRFLHAGADHPAQLAKIFDGAEVAVGRVVTGVR